VANMYHDHMILINIQLIRRRVRPRLRHAGDKTPEFESQGVEDLMMLVDS
jgi:hypothetical protein